jgi:PilZ domain
MPLYSSGYSAGIEERLAEHERAERYDLRLPVLVVREGRTPVCNTGETLNLSSSGVMMTLQTPIASGEAIEYFIQLFALVPGPHAIRLHCKGRVIRREGLTCAATIDRYEFLRDQPPRPASPAMPDDA